MQNNCITDLLDIQEVKVNKIKNNEKLEIFIETKPKLHVCPSCNHFTKHVFNYKIQKIQHISIGQKSTFLFLRKRRYICNHC